MTDQLEKSMAPQAMTMDRLGERDELIVAQSTSQCFRCLCFQPSINWVIAEGNNFEPGSNPFSLDSVAWIHEESSFFDRCLSSCGAGCRETKYIQHSGPPPPSIMGENAEWFTCQFSDTPKNLSEEDRNSNIVATHEKNRSCGVYCLDLPCVCNFFGLPYLETKDASGRLLGKTQYVCDICFFVPKFDILDASGQQKYQLRPDTCIAGLCVQCRCDGKKGKCCRVPFILRDPETKDPIPSGITLAGKVLNAMVDTLWSGWKNEFCTLKNAYHLTFPTKISAEEKAVIIGSTLLLDVAIFEQQDDS